MPKFAKMMLYDVAIALICAPLLVCLLYFIVLVLSILYCVGGVIILTYLLCLINLLCGVR